jgi:membrane associated rhomboid family serine protease
MLHAMAGQTDRVGGIGLVVLRWLWDADEDGLRKIVASTPVVWTVLLVTVAISSADYAWHGKLIVHLGLSTATVAQGQWWRLVTPILLNGPINARRVHQTGLEHLLNNVVTLVLAGPRVERYLGRLRFVTLYAIAALAGCVALLVGFTFFWFFVDGSSMSTLGLEGAILVLAFVQRHDSRAKRWYFVASWAAIALGWLSGLYLSGPITNILHLGGFLAGVVLTAAWSVEGSQTKRLGVATVVGLVTVSLVLAGAVSAKARRVDPHVLAEVQLVRTPALLTVAFGSLWVDGSGNGRLVRVDPLANNVAAQIRSASFGGGMVAVNGSLWVAAGKSVVEIDPKSNRVLSRIGVPGGGPWGLTATAGAIWAALPDKDEVARIDVRSRHVTLTPVGRKPYAVMAGLNGVFVTSYNSRRLSRLDARTGRVVAATQFVGHPYWIESADGSIWVGVQTTVYRIDPATLRTIAKVELRQAAFTMAVDGRCLWVSEGSGAGVSCIDTQRNRLSKRLRLGLRQPVAVASWEHDLWIADSEGSALVRIRP